MNKYLLKSLNNLGQRIRNSLLTFPDLNKNSSTLHHDNFKKEMVKYLTHKCTFYAVAVQIETPKNFKEIVNLINKAALYGYTDWEYRPESNIICSNTDNKGLEIITKSHDCDGSEIYRTWHIACTSLEDDIKHLQKEYKM